jgi:alkaline phosphatase D
MAVVVAGAAPVACYSEAGEDSVLSHEESASFFPQSVASGDPRPESVVLWTRVVDEFRAGQHLTLSLLVALDPELEQRVELSAAAQVLLATVEADHCLLVQLTELEPATTYYYRFEYQAHHGIARSRVGRTRTAPAADSDVPVRFGVVCCQDYGGKYFHVHRHLAEQELDFVLHLGDYVYESTGDPSFQSPTEQRRVTFSEPEQALERESRYLAAKSLSNYRDLYKIYRSDPDLQALHERHPVIAIWDDHEFSDDCHGNVATYQDGREDESSPERRDAAEQAWFEFMPVDYETAPAARFDASKAFEERFAIYRSFGFGRHLELLVTDLRRYRPDHLVPEDAAPGAVYMTQSAVERELDELPPDTVPYVDLETFADGAYLEALQEGADTLGVTAEKLTGNTSAVWINQSLTALESELEPIDLEDASLERGYAYHCLLKSSEFSSIGARYVVGRGPFEALAKQRFRESDGQSENLMGSQQRDWFLKTLRASERTFKVWASEVVVQPRHIDLNGLELAPPELRIRIGLSAEDWDGFPNERRALLDELSQVGNAVILSGDLHCFFAGTPYVDGDPKRRVVELTTSSVSSTTWLDAIEGILSGDASLPMNTQLLVQNIGALLADDVNRPNPHLAYQELGRHGYSLIEVGREELSMTLYSISSEDVRTAPDRLDGALDDHFQIERFRTRAGSADLEHERDGEFRTWSIEEMDFA